MSMIESLYQLLRNEAADKRAGLSHYAQHNPKAKTPSQGTRPAIGRQSQAAPPVRGVEITIRRGIRCRDSADKCMARTPATILLLPVLASLAPGQNHTRSDLVLGNLATFAADSANGQFALFAFSLLGTGSVGCLPGLGCIEVLPPLLVSPVVAAAPDGICRFAFEIPAALPLPQPLGSQALLLEPGQLLLTNALDGPIVPLSAFDDEFAGGALDPAWQVYNPQLVQFSVGGGALHVQPTQGGPAATWYANGEGPAFYRVVRGDFTVTAVVRAYRLSNPSQPPPADYDMAGLSLRDPASLPGAHDWLHVAVGGGDAATPIAVEDKSTDDSVSDLVLHPIAAPMGEIRATRQGALVSLYYRTDAQQPWTLLRAHWRPDLGPELQVGPHCFSWSPVVDIGASFDEVHFTRP